MLQGGALLTLGLLLLSPRAVRCSDLNPAPSYVGCFADCTSGSQNRAMPYNAGNLPKTDSPAACTARCPGSEYIGLQDGQDCFCGNGTGYSSQGVSLKCTMNCTGDTTAICGGGCANSVYWIGAGPAPAPPAPGPSGPQLPAAGAEADPSPHDIIWRTPSTTGARGALPLGNGECSASVWVEPNGNLLIYVVKSDSFDELTSRDKLARLRVRTDPPIQTVANFSQRLVLKNASVVIQAKGVRIDIIVDATAPTLRLRAMGTEGVELRLHASLEVWRTGLAHAQGYFCSAWNRSADTVLTDTAEWAVPKDAIGVAHANPDKVSAALIRDTLTRQGIDMGAVPIYNPMHGRSFGVWVAGAAGAASLKRMNATTLSSAAPALEHSLVVTMLTTVDTKGSSLQGWAKQAEALAKVTNAASFDAAAALHAKEWSALWERSWVWVSTNCSWCHAAAKGSDVAGDPTAMLTLQRYLDLANGRQAKFPIHGGGQAWGADGCVDDNSPLHPCTDSVNPCEEGPTNSGLCNPDNYNWWTYYWQEGRHPYYSALPAGDGADMLPALYRVYAQTLPLHQARVRSWYNHSGAVFPERFFLFGPIDSPTYGCVTPPRSPDLVTGLYQKYHIMGTLALCSLGLDDWDYHSGNVATADTAARERMLEFVLPICLNATTFYDEHYSLTGGKLDMFPSQGEETWQCPNPHNRSQCTTNPASDIAGLWAITDRLLRPDLTTGHQPLVTASQAAALRRLVLHVPPLPSGPRPAVGGYSKASPTTDRVYLPASSVPTGGPENSENIELHSVFPFRLTHIGEDESLMNMSVARATFAHRMFPCDANLWWCEDGNLAALLGLAEQARHDVLAAVSTQLVKTSPGWRFPLWHSGGGDTTPSMMPQNILRQTLHSMLLQHNRKGQILLFPTWPSGWDVSFKLHAPRGTVVVARCVNGSVEGLQVIPASRMADVRVLGCNASTAGALPHKSDDSDAEPANIVADPNFMQLGAASGWRCPHSQYFSDTDVTHSPASTGLRHSNSNAKLQSECTQTVIAAVAGRSYNASVWVKSQNISGHTQGATFCVE